MVMFADEVEINFARPALLGKSRLTMLTAWPARPRMRPPSEYHKVQQASPRDNAGHRVE